MFSHYEKLRFSGCTVTKGYKSYSISNWGVPYLFDFNPFTRTVRLCSINLGAFSICLRINCSVFGVNWGYYCGVCRGMSTRIFPRLIFPWQSSRSLTEPLSNPSLGSSRQFHTFNPFWWTSWIFSGTVFVNVYVLSGNLTFDLMIHVSER